jgi:hypothetical protein
MAAVMYELRTLANAGAAVVVLHHKPKGDGSQYRGSSDIRAGVDVAFAVSAAASSLDAEAAAPGRSAPARLLKFACFKNRLAPEFALTLRPELADVAPPFWAAGLGVASDAAESAGLKPGATHTAPLAPGLVVTDSPAASRHAGDVARLRELIAAHPGLTQNRLVEQSGLPQKHAIALLRKGKGRWWRIEEGLRGTYHYVPITEPDLETPGTGQVH